METALYHSPSGYYASKTEVVNDYYTSVDVHSIFGTIIARFFCRKWEKHFHNNKDFFIVECGPGSGKLAATILDTVQNTHPEFYGNLQYHCLEMSTARRKVLEHLKSRFPNHFSQGWPTKSKKFNGIVFSNEFFDALPVHRVIKTGGKLQEIFVALENSGKLVEMFGSPSPEVRNYFQWLGVEPSEDCIGEAHLYAREWMRTIARSLSKGLVLTIDYGFEANELYSDFRSEGTALCHSQHQTNRDFYRRIGEQDITAHVNFTTLIKEGKKWGWKAEPLWTQSQFLLENGLDDMLKAVQSQQDSRARLKLSSAIKSLVHPEGMGGTFKVLVQEKI